MGFGGVFLRALEMEGILVGVWVGWVGEVLGVWEIGRWEGKGGGAGSRGEVPDFRG